MAYIREVQKGLIEQHGFEKNEYGVPKNVPDGYYPMIIEGKLDHVEIKDGYIDCCNFENEKAINTFHIRRVLLHIAQLFGYDTKIYNHSGDSKSFALTKGAQNLLFRDEEHLAAFISGLLAGDGDSKILEIALKRKDKQ